MHSMVPKPATNFQEHSSRYTKVSELPRRQLGVSSNNYAAMSLIPYSLCCPNCHCLYWEPNYSLHYQQFPLKRY
jgi:hypothetical protein